MLEQPELELVALNEIGSLENMAYLLKHDTVYGRYERPVEVLDDRLVVDGRPLTYLSEPDPERLPWRELGVVLRPGVQSAKAITLMPVNVRSTESRVFQLSCSSLRMNK